MPPSPSAKHYNRPYYMDERPRLVHDFLPSPPPRARHADSALSQSSNDGAVLPTMVLFFQRWCCSSNDGAVPECGRGRWRGTIIHLTTLPTVSGNVLSATDNCTAVHRQQEHDNASVAATLAGRTFQKHHWDSILVRFDAHVYVPDGVDDAIMIMPLATLVYVDGSETFTKPLRKSEVMFMTLLLNTFNLSPGFVVLSLVLSMTLIASIFLFMFDFMLI
ncbi:hypothetical protein MY3296_008315 [Beauveria thailandica]